MNPRDWNPRQWGARTWGVIGFWFVAGLTGSVFYYFTGQSLEVPLKYWQSLYIWGHSSLIWTLCTLLILRFVDRFPIRRENLARSARRYITAGLLLSLVLVGLDFVFSYPMHKHRWEGTERFLEAAEYFKRACVSGYVGNLILLLGMAAFGHALIYYRKYRDHEVEAVRLEARLAEAQLRVLERQLHPHFLFNTLHAISTLIHRDPDLADAMIMRLSDLLRLSLRDDDRQEVPLVEELEFLDKYLQIEQMRFQDRLEIERSIDPESLEAMVPRMILQPLVENAIRHGIEPRSGPGRIDIVSRRDNGSLILQVSDNGVGLQQDRAFKPGVGIGNTRKRLEQLYGPAQEFVLNEKEGKGLSVNLRIPYHSMSKESSEA